MAAGFTPDGMPSRPYSSPDQLGGNAPRSQEFNTGASQTGNAAPSAGQDAGLNLNSWQFAGQVPHGVVQTSLLQPANPVTSNGMAAQDYDRVIPGLSKPLPSPNGSSQDSWAQGLYMRLQGRDEI